VVEVGKAKAEISNLLVFAGMTELAPMPTNFVASNLTINPSPPQPEQPIAINLTVTNSGSTIGNHELQLRIDGIVRAARAITLTPGSSEVVNFEVSDLAVGEHQVEVGGLTSQFTIVSRHHGQPYHQK
jgi:hypothetical protein